MRILHVGYGFRPWRHGGLIAYAEDVMDGQVARGCDVGYFCRGRHYPGLRDDRLRTWARRGILIHEILNSSLGFGGHDGTLTPEADLQHAPSERHFAAVLDEFRPDVVHIHEIIGLPTSLIEIAGDRGVPVIATLQDYFPLCPVLKLYDVDDQICLRHDVGAQCARCSAHAPDDRRMFGRMTRAYEVRRVLGEQRTDVVKRLVGAVRPGGRSASQPPESPSRSTPSAERYQARRDTNVERLSRMDALVAQSHRVGEIYAQLGVDESRIRVLHLTLRHLASMTPATIAAPTGPVRFATLNGATSVQKGSELLLDALAELQEAGLADRFTLTVLGYVPDHTRERLDRFPNVEVRGPYAAADVDSVLDGFHVGIVPSIWEEAYGYVGPEFLAKGIPVIGNARGGIVDYTRDGETGWVNQDANASGLAAIVADIVERPEQVAELNRWILDHRDELIKPLERHLDELQGIYDEVIHG